MKIITLKWQNYFKIEHTVVWQLHSKHFSQWELSKEAHTGHWDGFEWPEVLVKALRKRKKEEDQKAEKSSQGAFLRRWAPEVHFQKPWLVRSRIYMPLTDSHFEQWHGCDLCHPKSENTVIVADLSLFMSYSKQVYSSFRQLDQDLISTVSPSGTGNWLLHLASIFGYDRRHGN